jgi:hypothetical protein
MRCTNSWVRRRKEDGAESACQPLLELGDRPAAGLDEPIEPIERGEDVDLVTRAADGQAVSQRPDFRQMFRRDLAALQSLALSALPPASCHR